MNKAATTYLHQINQQIPCPRAAKKQFLRQMKQELAFFCSAHKNVSTDQLYEHYGLPEDVAADFITDMELRLTDFYRSRKQMLINLTACVLAAVILFTAVIGVRISLLHRQISDDTRIASISYETKETIFVTPRK